MPQDVTIYSVIIASPGDVPAERKAAIEVVRAWNTENCLGTNVRLEPIAYEEHAAHVQLAQPQDLINRQLVESADFAIGVFWNRAGTPTRHFAGGAIEEIAHFIKKRCPAIVFFCDAPLKPSEIDLEQHKRLVEFRRLCEQNGLINSYSNVEDFAAELKRQIGHVMSLIRSDQHLEFYTRKNPGEKSAYSVEQDFARLELQAKYTLPSDQNAIAYARAGIGGDPARKLKVLDVGCGNGIVTFSRFGGQTAFEVLAIDKSSAAIDLAKQHYSAENIQYRTATLAQTSGLDWTPDIIFCSLVLHHLGDEDEDGLKQLWSHMRPGGALIVRSPDDGLILNYPIDQELEDVLQKNDEIMGAGARKHARKVAWMIDRLSPRPSHTKMIIGTTSTISGGPDQRVAFFDYLFGFRQQAFDKLAADHPTKPNVALAAKVKDVLQRKRLQIAGDDHFFSGYIDASFVALKR